jgi:hypothetical protein
VPRPATETIEGSYRVVATKVLPAARSRRSPNRERAVARIFFWNAALVAAVVFLPQVIG